MNEDMTLPYFLTTDDPASIYLNGSYVALDFEADSEGKGSPLVESNDLILACWSVYRDGVEVKRKHIFGGIYDMQELIDDIHSVDFLLAFNAKYELGWLKRCGMELRDVLVYDPMLGQWVLDGNRKGKGYERSLRGMARRYGAKPKLDLVGKLLDQGIPTRDINQRWLLEYCYRDVDSMVEVFQKQMEVVDKRNVWHLVHTRNLTCAVLADIEFVGLQLDKERVFKAHKEAKARMAELENELADMTGGINVNSPKQLTTYLYDTLGFKEARDHKGKVIRTDSDERTAKAEVIGKLEATTAQQEKFLSLYKEYNKVGTLLSKNLDYFNMVCLYQDGTFLGQIKQNATGTHRLASAGVKGKFPISQKVDKKGNVKIKYKEMGCQIQNIPREYKNLFYAADDDYVICSYDSSQVEFRMAVDMGQDKVGYKEVTTGTDIHQYTAQVLYQNGDPEMLSLDDPKERRQQSKKNTFRPLFGGSSGSEALQAYCEFFKNKYEGISSMQHGWALKCADQKEYTTPYGMTFYFPAEVSRRTGYISYTTSIYNYPIQGISTGEIIPIALVYFWHRTRNLRVNIFVTIHDSIDARVHKEDVEQADAIAIQCLTTDVYEHMKHVYRYEIKTPLGLGMKHAKHWNEGDEIKWDVFPNGEMVAR